MSTTRRLAYLDALKIVSIYFVVIIHVVGFKLGTFTASLDWFSSHFVSMMARFAVPAFIMCSGAVLLSRTTESFTDVKRFYGKYLTSYGGYLFLGLVIAKGLAIYLNIPTPLLKGIVYDYYDGFGSGMWFFFMLIGLVLVAPILQQLAKNRSMEKLFVMLWVFFSIMNPLFSNILGLYKSYIDNMLYGSYFVGYFVLGHLLATTTRRFNTRALVICAASGLVLATLSGFALSMHTGSLSEFFYYSNNPFIMVYTASLFLLFKSLLFGDTSTNMLKHIASTTGYIYIFHTAVMSIVPIGYSTNLLKLVFIRTPGIVIISMAIAFAYILLHRGVKRIMTAHHGLAPDAIFQAFSSRMPHTMHSMTVKFRRFLFSDGA